MDDARRAYWRGYTDGWRAVADREFSGLVPKARAAVAGLTNYEAGHSDGALAARSELAQTATSLPARLGSTLVR